MEAGAMPEIACIPLMDGEYVALSCVEIIAVPHVSILDESARDATELIERCNDELMGCLGEVYQVYRSMRGAQEGSPEAAVELLWVTEPIEHQAYRAAIRPFLVFRALSAREDDARQTTFELERCFRSLLATERYDIAARDVAQLASVVHGISDETVLALVKEERVENLQSSVVSSVYGFETIGQTNDDLGRVVSSLADHPGCALSIQLMPTVYTPEEAACIDQATQTLEMLMRGISDPGMGNVSFALAERPASVYGYYSDRKNSPIFSFNVLVYGDPLSAREIMSRYTARLASGNAGRAPFRVLSLAASEVGKDVNFYPLPWAVGELLANRDRDPSIWASGRIDPACYRLPFIVGIEEAAELARLPIGSDRVSVGLTINRSSRQTRTYADNLINAGDITVGALRTSGTESTIGFRLPDLAKHMLVVGTPGSGKTTFSVGLLDRLWKEHHIPFLVIEPAKNEYRALVQSIPDLQVFTPGKSHISPFVFNPFVPPKNVRLEAYKSTLKTAFAAGVSMTTPLDKIFEQAISNCYSDFRWLDTYTSDDAGRTFNISDFIKCFQETFAQIGYVGDASNIGRAGTVRLKSLEGLFDTYETIPIEDLLSRPTVIELAAIENSDQKALIISLLLLSILSYVNANYLGEGGLRNVILLEEAHVLLDAESNGQGDSNPSLVAQGLVKRMLAEIRSYGVGLIIADQSPRKVTTDVVALTDIKVAFRLVEAEDKRILGDSINMTSAQLDRLGGLHPGEAFLFFNRLEAPEEVVTPNYRLENNIDITLSDEGIRELSTYWRGREGRLRPYPECRLCACCQKTCDYERRVIARDVARRIFVRHFTAKDKTFEPLKGVLRHISALVRAELNNEPFTYELLLCTKVHLWRRVRYETHIPITDRQIKNSLSK